MSNRRARVSRFTEDEVNDLILKLQAFLPDSSSRCNTRASASKILEETCNYIKKLHKEVDNLSDRLSQLLASEDITGTDADIIRRLLKLPHPPTSHQSTPPPPPTPLQKK